MAEPSALRSRKSKANLPSEAWERLEPLVERFEDAWRRGERPAVEDYLRGAGLEERRFLLVELVHADLDYRLRAGEPARVEDYLIRYPLLHEDSSAVIDLVLAEYSLRRERGGDFAAAEYLERFPQYRNELLPRMSTVDERLIGEGRQEMAEFRLSTAASPELDWRDYQLIESLGQGGMGEVYRCCDPALGRDLAIKVMKADPCGYVELERRFLREACITGSLQHPGIVAVHNLGRLADGRLHYTMRLVRGKTFAEILKHEAGKPERLPDLLSIFEKICQAVAYAHSKRVIHRDLKPSNVMVGKFGEVQVMDWGLAKLLTSGQETNSPETSEEVGTVVHTEQVDTPLDLSRDGAVLGTPAYMPPEQAAGDWSIVDERADVFALGAILCEILTGQPPYQGANEKKLLRQARLGDRAEALARLDQCSADAALTALCRECLAPEREERPRDARAVADRVQEYQAAVQERLRQAELNRVAAETRAREEQARAAVEAERTREAGARAAAEAERAREAEARVAAETERASEALARARAERRARRRTLAMAALGLVLLIGVCGALWWRQQQIEKADMAVSNSLAQVELLAEQARADPLQTDRYRQVLEAARIAAQLADSASAAARQQAAELIARLKNEEEAATKDRQLLSALLDVRNPREGPKYKSDAKGTMMPEPTADEQFTAAFRRWGLAVDSTPTSEAAALLRARPALVVTELIAALDEWASERRRQGQTKEQWQRLTDLATLLDDNPGSKRRELREILVRGRLHLERALSVVSATVRPVLLSFEVPLGRDHIRLVQLAEQTDPPLLSQFWVC